jgi:hypothetical protein
MMARQAGNAGLSNDDLEAAMRVEIDAMQRVLGLNPASAKKLEVAAMAAIKTAIKKNPPKPTAFPMLGDSQQPQIKEGTLSDEDAERQKEKERAKVAATAGAGNPWIQTVTLDMVKQEDLWKRTVSNTLTSDQIAKFESLQAERKASQKALAIQNKLSELDAILWLTEDQRILLTQLISDKLGEQLANKPKMGGFGAGAGQMIVVMGGVAGKELEADDVRSILSESQMKEFERQRKLSAAGPLGMLPPQIGQQLGIGSETASPLGFDVKETPVGLRVTKIADRSDALQAGLKEGDLIDSVGKSPVDTSVQLKRAMNSAAFQSSPVLQIIRDGQKMTLEFRSDSKNE